jgi:hypothetical protein
MVKTKTHKVVRTFGDAELPDELAAAVMKEAEGRPGKFLLLMGNDRKVDEPKVSKKEKNIKVMFEFTEVAQGHTWGMMLVPLSKRSKN